MDKELQKQLQALGIYPGTPQAQAFAAMEPELRQELVAKMQVPGTRAANATINAYNERKRSSGMKKEEEAALDARIAKALEGQPPEVIARTAGLRDPEKINDVIKQFNNENAERERIANLWRTGSILGGGAIGFAGGKLADKMSRARIQEEMAARSPQISRAAEAIRNVDTSIPEPNLRAAYGRAASGARINRVVPSGSLTLAPLLIGTGLYSTLERAPESKTELERAAWNGTGYGEMTLGGKLIANSVGNYFNPGKAYPADDVGAVKAARDIAAGGPIAPIPGANKPGGPQQLPQAPFSPGGVDMRQHRIDTLKQTMSREQLAERVTKMGLGVKSSMNKTDLAGLIVDRMEAKATTGAAPVPAPEAASATPTAPRSRSKLPSIFGWGGAGLAGVTAFDAARSRAMAEGLSPEQANWEGLKSGALSGGTAAGTYYGATKGLDYAARRLAPYALGRAVVRALPYALPASIAYDIATADVHGNEGPNGEIMPTGPREFDKQRADAEELRRNPELVRRRQLEAERRRRAGEPAPAPLFMPQPPQAGFAF